jgi:hypothetical protein
VFVCVCVCVCEGDSIYLGAFPDYVFWGWIGESHMVCVAYLFVLQVYASSFGIGYWGEMVCHFSQHSKV